MAGNRFRFVDYTHNRFFERSDATAYAAEEIIATPDKHLLTQSEIFNAEGGYLGLAVQAGAVGVGLAALFSVRPLLLTYLKNGQLKPMEWLAVGGSAFASYHVGHYFGVMAAGDKQKLQNHWMAYYFVKQNNRFEGRQILSKKPMTY